jgi:hypothetical protein
MGAATVEDAAQGGSDVAPADDLHVQVVCALSGQLLARATLATPTSWAQARRSLVGAMALRCHGPHALQDGTGAATAGTEAPALQFRFSYVTSSLALSSESSWALCTALWKSKGADAAKVLTVTRAASPGADGDGAADAETLSAEVHALASADCAVLSPQEGAPQAPMPRETIASQPASASAPDMLPSSPPACPVTSSICSPLSRLGDFGSLFEHHVSFDPDVPQQREEQRAGTTSLPHRNGQKQRSGALLPILKPPAVTAAPATPTTGLEPPPSLLNRGPASLAEVSDESVACPAEIQVLCSDPETGQKLTKAMSVGAADSFQDVHSVLSSAIEASVSRRVASLHFASPSGGLFDLDSESSWKFCKGLAAASGHPTSIQLLAVCGAFVSAVTRENIEEKEEVVRLASEKISREIRKTPWYTALEKEMQQPSANPGPVRLLEEQYRCFRSPQRQSHSRQQPPETQYSSPAPIATGSSVAADLPAEELLRLKDIRAQMRRMTGALGPSDDSARRGSGEGGACEGAHMQRHLQPLPASRKPFQPRQQGRGSYEAQGMPGSAEKPPCIRSVTPDLPAEEMQRLEDIRTQMCIMMNALG